ncbi:MAG TPA: hypothetical protein P5210_08810 [Draconibacterium sp.]|nr:hypothetical protein [Draconibacterium sp.]HRX11735.1 hypothetical protein [Draconibacterium sp.]
MKVVFYWILAVIITFAAIIYQRKTGPTYDKKTEVTIDNRNYKFKLVRSHGGTTDCKIQLGMPDKNVDGVLEYKKYPTKDEWTLVELTRENDLLTGSLPNLPPAGKYEYKITLRKGDQNFALNEGKPVIIRFKGHVPETILFPHIFFMFFAMFLGNVAGIMALFKYKKFRFYTNVTVIALFIGGMILGPLVQLYAFNELWAGIPFAWDLTDNKTLVAFLFWVLAFFMNRKKERPIYTIMASIVMLIVYSIPHSMFGSQLDPETGEIIQGWIRLYIF